MRKQVIILARLHVPRISRERGNEVKPTCQTLPIFDRDSSGRLRILVGGGAKIDCDVGVADPR